MPSMDSSDALGSSGLVRAGVFNIAVGFFCAWRSVFSSVAAFGVR